MEENQNPEQELRKSVLASLFSLIFQYLMKKLSKNPQDK